MIQHPSVSVSLIDMLTKDSSQLDTIWDGLFPDFVRLLPNDLARLDQVLDAPGVRAALGPGQPQGRPPQHRDDDLRAPDGAQASSLLGLRAAGPTGGRLLPPSTLLSDLDRGRGPRRVNHPQT